MKKLLVLMLVVAMILFFAACGGNGATTTPTPSPEPTPTETAPDGGDDLADEEDVEETPADPVVEGSVVGPARITVDTVSFEIFDGWSFSEGESAHSVINVTGGENDVVIIFVHPNDMLSSDELLSRDLLVTMEVLILNTWINNLFETTQNETRAVVRDMQYPAVFVSYIAQNLGGTWAPANSILFYGETQYVMVHTFMREMDDDFLDIYMEFLRSISFAE